MGPLIFHYLTPLLHIHHLCSQISLSQNKLSSSAQICISNCLELIPWKQTPRWRFIGRKLIGQCSWDQRQSGRGGGRLGQLKKLNGQNKSHNQSHKELWNQGGLRICPVLGPGLYVSTLVSHWYWFPRKTVWPWSSSAEGKYRERLSWEPSATNTFRMREWVFWP